VRGVGVRAEEPRRIFEETKSRYGEESQAQRRTEIGKEIKRNWERKSRCEKKTFFHAFRFFNVHTFIFINVYLFLSRSLLCVDEKKNLRDQRS